MDAQEIPLLTEVYKTKSSPATTNDGSPALTAEDVVEIVDDYKAGIEAEVAAEVLKTLKPQLTAEITETLTQHLTHTLIEKITQQLSSQSLSGEWLTNIRQEIVEALKPTNHTMAALQNAFTNQAEIDPDVILQAVEQKNNVFLVEAQQALDESHQRLIQAHAERMNLDIASKITGMQELAVTQAKSQIMQQMAEAEEAFSLNVHAQAAASQQKTVDAIRASQEAYADSLASYAADMQAQANERLKTYFDAQVTVFSQDVLSEHKQAFTNEMSAFYQTQSAESNQAHQAELAELTNVYQAQIKQAKDGFNQQAQAVSGELLQVVTAYAQKLNEEADAKLASVQQSLQAQVADYARTLNEAADAKLASVQTTLQAQVADYATQLNEETTAKLLAVQQTVQASMTSYAQQVADETRAIGTQHEAQTEAKIQQIQDGLLANVTGYTQTLLADAQALNQQAQALSEQARQQLQTAQASLLEQATEQVQSSIQSSLDALVQSKREAFKLALDADVPEVEKLMDARIQHMVKAALPDFEDALMEKIKAEITGTLSTIRLVLPNDRG